uniref:Uncharacterized protein n=1 Tax=Anguilla anguilla TaxID=7936 RepID=A0A0E9SPZ8_ANGAN
MVLAVGYRGHRLIQKAPAAYHQTCKQNTLVLEFRRT